jgi:hypothetical protein
VTLDAISVRQHPLGPFDRCGPSERMKVKLGISRDDGFATGVIEQCRELLMFQL